jgi:hypothetical protein
MRIEALTVALRPRTAWEAVELGMALVRRHASAIWLPWLILTLPVLALVNLLAWSIDAIWLAALVMWWLKPLFDRIALYVLAHAVFGDVPGARRTLLAQRHWGLRWMPAYLTWRRLGPVRSLYLPVDLLEGGQGEDARHRRRALGVPVYGVGVLLTTVCVHFQFVLSLGALTLAMLFIPGEYLAESARWAWSALTQQPVWLQLAFNAVAWLATMLIEPFFVGAGFGLYLNRRTEIEGWDIEIVLRRLRTRIGKVATPLLLAVALLGVAGPGRAQDARPGREEGTGRPANRCVRPRCRKCSARRWPMTAACAGRSSALMRTRRSAPSARWCAGNHATKPSPPSGPIPPSCNGWRRRSPRSASTDCGCCSVRWHWRCC